MILWLLPLIKNFRKDYFFFFLGVALQDPGNLFFYNFLKLDPNYWVIFCQLFIIYTLELKNKKFKKIDPIIIGITVLFSFIGFYSNLIYMALCLVILLKISSNIIEELKYRGYINIFVVAIAFYVFNLLLNALFVSTQSLYKETYYVYTFISMFAFALFFTFTNEKTKFLNVNIKKYLVKANDNKNYNSR